MEKVVSASQRGSAKDSREVGGTPFICTLGAIAIVSIISQLWGLRFTNHDDIYFNLASHVYEGNFVSFAREVALKQARIQAYVNMPITLWVHQYGVSWIYDLCSIGTFLLLYCGLFFYLTKIGSVRLALSVCAITLILFPLHYYFTFPQGYPVMGPLSLVLGFFAAVLYSYYLQSFSPKALLLSSVLFTLSLWGPEYTVLLHPALLVVIAINTKLRNSFAIVRSSILYVLCWSVTVGIYLFYSLSARAIGGDANGRVSVGFDIIAFLKTFFILLERAFLPLGLIRGIGLYSSPALGAPSDPTLLSYSSLFAELTASPYLIVLFCVATFISWQTLRMQTFDKENLLGYVSLFLLVAVIPLFVVSLSSHYQDIVTKGYLKGHLVSFYAQLGLTAIVFLLLSLIVSESRHSSLGLPVSLLAALVLACWSTLTVAYNLINRNAMMINQQTWQAMNDVVTLLRHSRSDLASHSLYAADLWASAGVSNKPRWEDVGKENYWSAYTRWVLHYPLSVVQNQELTSKDSVTLRFVATTQGTPLTALIERVINDGEKKWKVTVLASQPIHGRIVLTQTGSNVRQENLDRWACDRICTTVFVLDDDFEPNRLAFQTY